MDEGDVHRRLGMSRRTIEWVALGLCAALPLAAQSPAPLATVRGIVIDSLRGRPLVGASIAVDGTIASGVTDSLGQFRIDSVTPGAHPIAVYHPLLDSLALSLYTAPVNITPGAATVVSLGLPSLPTLLGRFCARDTTARILVAGRVLDTDNDTPIPNATVTGSARTASVVVNESNNRATFRRAPAVRTVRTDADGRFYFCLPVGSHFIVAASLGNSLTGEIPLALANDIALPSLRVSRADSAAARARATLTGHIETVDGRPLEGASIHVEGSSRDASSARDGSFTLTGAPTGTQLVSVRHVGYTESIMPVALSSASTRSVTTVLEAQVTKLAKVDVKTEALVVAAAYQRTGFDQRKQMGFGHYLTAEDIASHNGGTATSLLAGMPGIVLQYSSHGARVVSSRAIGGRNCTAFFVDGQYMPRGTSGDDDQTLPQASEIIGVEVYQPTEPIGGNPPSKCLTVLIWTKAALAR
jgi:carboxypeptidase-like protein/carboxypeptidase family protein/TonB-dependent receptor-like protein